MTQCSIRLYSQRSICGIVCRLHYKLFICSASFPVFCSVATPVKLHTTELQLIDDRILGSPIADVILLKKLFFYSY